MGTSHSKPRSRLHTVMLVACVALCSAMIITAAYEVSHERIRENERARLLASLRSVIDESSASPAVATELPFESTGDSTGIDRVFAMHRDSRLIAWVYAFFATQGYNGPMELLVGIRPDGTITRARVLQHRETPGLGDAIETEKSDWIRQFDNKSLDNPSLWALTLDDGSFDTITGATVTPRAVVAAIEDLLRYHSGHEDSLYEALEAAQATAP